MSRQNRRRRTPVYTLSLRRFKGESPTREHGEPARKKTETRNKAEAGKKCMSGRRVEERVKSNEATKGTRGSRQPSKGRAQGRRHGRHTSSTTPHRDTGEGSTRATREERHHAPRHARHRHHTHRTHPTSPGSLPSSGRAVGGGTAPDLRRPSQWWKVPPPWDALPPPPQRATPAHKGARRGAGAGSPRPHRPHPGHTGRGTQAARFRGRAAGGGTAPDTRRPSQRWQATPPGDGPPPAPRHAAPTGHAGQGDSVGPPHPHTRAHSTWVADPNSPPNGRPVGGGTAPDLERPSQWWKAPPQGTPFRYPHSEQRQPARAHAVGPVLGPHARTDRTRDTRDAGPWLPAPEDGRPGEGQRLTPGAPHNGGKHPPRGRVPATPTANNAGPQGRTLWGRCWVPTPAPNRTRDARDAEPRLPAPEDGRPGEGQRLTPGAPHNGGKHPPGDALPPPPQRATPARKGARCGAGAGSPCPHRPHPGHTGRGTLAARSRGRAAGGGTAPDTRRPSQWWKAPPPGTPFRHPHSEKRRPARAHAVGPVLGPHARTDRTRDTRDAGPWLPAPEDGRPGEGQRLTPGAPHNGGKHPPRGRPSATPTASNGGPQGRTLWGRCWVPTPAPTAPGTHGTRNPGCPLQRTGGGGRDSA